MRGSSWGRGGGSRGRGGGSRGYSGGGAFTPDKIDSLGRLMYVSLTSLSFFFFIFLLGVFELYICFQIFKFGFCFCAIEGS